MASGLSPGIAIFERGKRFHHLPYLNIFATQWHCPGDHPYSINGRMVPGIAIFERGKRFHQLNIFATQWHCPGNCPYSINGRMVPRNCYFRKGQAVPSTSLSQHFRDPMALPWQLSVLHKWQDGPPALLFSKGAEARVAFSISTFLRPNGIALAIVRTP